MLSLQFCVCSLPPSLPSLLPSVQICTTRRTSFSCNINHVYISCCLATDHDLTLFQLQRFSLSLTNWTLLLAPYYCPPPSRSCIDFGDPFVVTYLAANGLMDIIFRREPTSPSNIQLFNTTISNEILPSRCCVNDSAQTRRLSTSWDGSLSFVGCVFVQTVPIS